MSFRTASRLIARLYSPQYDPVKDAASFFSDFRTTWCASSGYLVSNLRPRGRLHGGTEENDVELVKPAVSMTNGESHVNKHQGQQAGNKTRQNQRELGNVLSALQSMAWKSITGSTPGRAFIGDSKHIVARNLLPLCKSQPHFRPMRSHFGLFVPDDNVNAEDRLGDSASYHFFDIVCSFADVMSLKTLKKNPEGLCGEWAPLSKGKHHFTYSGTHPFKRKVEKAKTGLHKTGTSTPSLAPEMLPIREIRQTARRRGLPLIYRVDGDLVSEDSSSDCSTSSEGSSSEAEADEVNALQNDLCTLLESTEETAAKSSDPSAALEVDSQNVSSMKNSSSSTATTDEQQVGQQVAAVLSTENSNQKLSSTMAKANKEVQDHSSAEERKGFGNHMEGAPKTETKGQKISRDPDAPAQIACPTTGKSKGRGAKVDTKTAENGRKMEPEVAKETGHENGGAGAQSRNAEGCAVVTAEVDTMTLLKGTILPGATGSPDVLQKDQKQNQQHPPESEARPVIFPPHKKLKVRPVFDTLETFGLFEPGARGPDVRVFWSGHFRIRVVYFFGFREIVDWVFLYRNFCVLEDEQKEGEVLAEVRNK
ncbi:unnamed protein product [Amoebophrya sp. A25]|nr:unnamed protein product [Amoebophrya sp. A25]|eukprot:GSA25T00016244001.1